MSLTIRSRGRIILPLRHRKPKGHVAGFTCAKMAIRHPDGTLSWIDDEWVPNFLAREGQASFENVYLRELTNPPKYIALLTTLPVFATTMASMGEVFTPPLNGYARQQVIAGDWSAPALSPDDYMTTAATKVFGPATSAWNDILAGCLVTALTGTGGLFLSAIPTDAPVDVPIGESLLYTMAQKGEVCS